MVSGTDYTCDSHDIAHNVQVEGGREMENEEDVCLRPDRR